MKKEAKIFQTHWGIIIALIIVIVATISYRFLDKKWIAYISYIAGVLPPLLQWSLNRFLKADDRIDYGKVIDDYRDKYQREIREKEKFKSGKEELKFENTELKKVLSKINETLQRENISKEELVRNTTSSLKAVLFFKTWEDTGKKRSKFGNEVYPEIGVVRIRAGLSILPPRRVPQSKSDSEIIKWFKKQITQRVPKDYEFNMPIISVINLKETSSFKRLEPFRKFQESFLDKIPIEELVPIQETMSYLHNKKHLASKDIIEIPNLVFLIEDYLITKSDLESLKKNNNKILTDIKKETQSEEIKTTDLATVQSNILQNVLNQHVSEPQEIAERIIENAKFWKNYFEHIKQENEKDI